MRRGCIIIIAFLFVTILPSLAQEKEKTWIRINQLGYLPDGIKVAVFCSKENTPVSNFQIVELKTKKIVFHNMASEPYGEYGPFLQTRRFDFSIFKIPGRYYLQANDIKSPEFEIGNEVYKGAADFCLRYLRQQRSGFNPYLKDSCHTHDGYVLYGSKAGLKDSVYQDVVGGWHDASDYLQYATTSANATWHLLAAYRDFPGVFADQKQANGTDGKNGYADILDEARWGLDWLLKMHPQKDIMFNQIGDDRDHISMRIPTQDSQYGRGFQRPVYFINGDPQQRGKFMNDTRGTSSTAAKFSSAFSLGSRLFNKIDKSYSRLLSEKSSNAFEFALRKLGVTQTVSVLSPYIYAEENWVDDMELAATSRSDLQDALNYAKQEPLTPWLGKDTAKHYQWYPFINLGHYELAKQLNGKQRELIIGYYKKGIEAVWAKAKENAFYRGIPFIWCSNNLTTSFAIQCYWYKQLSGDMKFEALEQANLDWLFGCNIWGTSMVYGLPSWGDTPVDPHSAFTHLKNYPIDGGLVDGPVYGSIYNNLIGIKLYNEDEYAAFQSNLAVYHDDYGDYSTNEPTMDGTASLIYLLAANENKSGNRSKEPNKILSHGGIIRGDTLKKKLALVFTGDEYGDGGNFIDRVLKQQKIQASFFLTGNFYRNPRFGQTIGKLKKNGNYLGSHSDKHLLYCDWEKRDSLLLTHREFVADLENGYKELQKWGIEKVQAPYFLPPYEWYNDSIAVWTNEMGLQIVNYTPGTNSNADYTYPEMGSKYKSSDFIKQSILAYEDKTINGLNGFILLIHIGTDPRRTDKFYKYLPELIKELKSRNYQFTRIDKLLK